MQQHSGAAVRLLAEVSRVTLMASEYRASAANETVRLRNDLQELLCYDMCEHLQELAIRNDVFQFLIADKHPG